ncbi:MAG: DNA mismatch repair protein MutS [Bacteroidota bacterium]|nr:DNA mismatch repair protein MutS [Bacteroidota bacterium]
MLNVFPESSLLTTEYEKIRDHIVSLCISPMGKDQVKQITIHTDAQFIAKLLQRTSEMRQVIASGLPFPAANFVDVSRELSLLRIENSTLSEEQFMAISGLMHTVKEVYDFLKNRKGIFPQLEAINGDTIYENSILKEIEEILDEHGQVRSSASPELTRIRRTLQRSRAEADRVYAAVINKFRRQGWLTESEESSRNGRRVVAIVAEQKRSIKGVIHDTSTTGKTAFIEPEETVGINNLIASLEQEERMEITRILRELASVLRKHVPLMQLYSMQLGTFDLNRAKALLAIQIDGKLPRISNLPVIDLKIARHPLLVLHNKHLHKPVIPFDLSLNSENRILVISGPNAGGKTVCMKTSGLLQMMFQSGMLVSAHDDSTFGIFENLLVDIGDSQSIEYELSTYSSRLRHMRIFLERVNEKSLFLIDEFGTGTDPNLGGALAEAVLEELNNRKAFGIITTHYLNLKVLADRTPGLMNGSMEFDLKRLRPLYKLSVGKPGSSYTFLVAERSGLPRQLIKDARRKVNRKNLLLEKLLTEVEHDKAQIKSNTVELEKKNKELSELIKKYEILSRETTTTLTLKEQKLKKLEERILRESEERFRGFLKDWKKSKDKKEIFEKYYKQFVRKKTIEDPKVTARKKQEKLKALQAIIKPGAVVRLENGSMSGVVEQVDAEKAYVIFGNVKAVCEIVNLVPVEKD